MCFADYDPPEFVDERIQRSRKPRPCFECGRPVPVGSLYLHVAGKWDSFETFSVCGSCVATRERVIDAEIAAGCKPYEAEPPYGGVLECLSHYDPPVVRATTEEGQVFLAARKTCSTK